MNDNFLDFSILPANLLNVYKSQSMREILEKIKDTPLKNSVFYIYGEKGTEKIYIMKAILYKMPNYILLKNPKDLKGKLTKKENIVFMIEDIEKFDFSLLEKHEQVINCIIFLQTVDFEILLREGKIDLQKYDFLKKAHKIYIPPLNSRKQDIVPIANMLLREISEFLGISQKELSKDAREALTEYPWPENFYQLKKFLTKSCINSKHKKLTSKDIFNNFHDKLSIKNFLESKIGSFLSDFSKIENSNLYETIIQEVEKALFCLVLNEAGNNQLKAAKILGINRNTLSKKLKIYNLI